MKVRTVRGVCADVGDDEQGTHLHRRQRPT
jgi:hypothetical protein